MFTKLYTTDLIAFSCCSWVVLISKLKHGLVRVLSTCVRSKCYLNCNCNFLWPFVGGCCCFQLAKLVFCRSLSKCYSIINNFSFIISQLNNIFWWYTLISTYTYIYSGFHFFHVIFFVFSYFGFWGFSLFCKVLYIYGNYCVCVFLLLLRMQMLQQTLLVTFN